jgi:hypothetical protein
VFKFWYDEKSGEENLEEVMLFLPQDCEVSMCQKSLTVGKFLQERKGMEFLDLSLDTSEVLTSLEGPFSFKTLSIKVAAKELTNLLSKCNIHTLKIINAVTMEGLKTMLPVIAESRLRKVFIGLTAKSLTKSFDEIKPAVLDALKDNTTLLAF